MTEMYWKLGMILVVPLLLILWWCWEDTDPARVSDPPQQPITGQQLGRLKGDREDGDASEAGADLQAETEKGLPPWKFAASNPRQQPPVSTPVTASPKQRTNQVYRRMMTWPLIHGEKERLDKFMEHHLVDAQIRATLLDETVGPEFVCKFRQQQSE